MGQRVHSTDYRYSIVINDTMDVPDVSGSISMMWALQALRETRIPYALLSVPEKQKKAGHKGPEILPLKEKLRFKVSGHLVTVAKAIAPVARYDLKEGHRRACFQPDSVFKSIQNPEQESQ